MIEVIVRKYLATALDGVPVKTEVPKNPLVKFCIVEKTGGTIEEHIRHSTVVVQSYGESMQKAAELSEEVVALMCYGLVGLAEVSKVTLNSEYNYTDTAEKKYRYQAVFDITHY
jgi:hypothetical protein